MLRRRRATVVLAFATLVVLAATLTTGASGHRSTPTARAPRVPAPPPAPTSTAGETTTTAAPASRFLRPGSDPSVLPGPVLVADRDNDRLVEIDPRGRVVWTFPRPGDLPAGTTFRVPDDAFFTPGGRRIVVTQEDDFVVSLVDRSARHIVWRYGEPGVHGYGPNRLWNPDDAMVLPDGHVLVSDIKHCRILLIPSGAHAPDRILGRSTTACLHEPPFRFGSPNGAFPMRDGHYLVTEINGAWVDAIDLSGHVYWETHPPSVHYPSDTNEVSPGVYLTVDYHDPGAAVLFDPSGRELWRYAPTGRDALRWPSLALPLPNGDVILDDDGNHRVIVVDPRTDRIVWQYGHTGVPGRAPGYLDHPDGLDLAPPHSLLVTHAATMGRP